MHNNVLANQRIIWIDSLKGFGIFLVFLGHCTTNPGINKYIFSFHIPLFFLISGLFFKKEFAEKGINRFMFSRVQRRLVPYISFGLLTYFIWVAHGLSKKYGLHKGSMPVPKNFYKPLIGMLYGNGIKEWIPHNGLLWFLACLFITEILMFSIFKFTRKRANIIIIIFIFSIVGYIDSKFLTIRLPFSIDVAFTAVVFYSFGFIFKDYLLTFRPYFLITVSCLIFGFLLSHYNSRADLNYNVLGNYFLFYISAFSTIYGYFCIAKLIPNFKILSVVGQNSLAAFLLQDQAFLAIRIIFYLFTHIKLSQIDLNLPFTVAYVLVAISLTIPVSYFIHWKVPFIIGK